jgi:hypothetical protein
MSLASNWVIVNCDAKSDQAQQVTSLCYTFDIHLH